MTEQITMIPARLKNAAVNGHVAGAADIIDDAKAKTQDVINAEVDTEIGDDSTEGSIKGRIKSLEEAVGPGGSVEEQIDAKVATLDASVSQAAGADGLALSVTEVDGIVTSVSGSIAANTYDAYGSAAAEATRAQGAENTLDGKIAAEKTRAEGAESTLQGNIDSEASRASTAESGLQDAIDAEETRAKAAEGTLDGKIDQEITDRAADVDAEETRAKAAEQANATAIATEKTRAEGAESTLTTNLAAEVTRAQGAEGTLTTNLSNEVTRAQAAEQQNASDIDAIEAKIPTQASSTNQLADKEFVNSSISTSTATFRGTSEAGLTEQQFLAWANTLTKDANDYVFWNTADAAGNVQFKRYKYNGTAWVYEYTLNNSSFTSEQWAAIQSGITSALTGKLSALPTNAELTEALAGKQAVISDLDTIRSGAAAGATAYQKPSTGIPSTDLTSAAQTSLGLADTALQPSALNDYYDKDATDGLLDAKQDTLVSGTNIKTINNNSLLGSGNIDIQTGGTYTEGNGIDITNDEISVKAGSNLSFDANGNLNATDTTYSVMGGSGASHASGLVPDPGATAGTTKYLREDGTWQEVSALPEVEIGETAPTEDVKLFVDEDADPAGAINIYNKTEVDTLLDGKVSNPIEIASLSADYTFREGNTIIVGTGLYKCNVTTTTTPPFDFVFDANGSIVIDSINGYEAVVVDSDTLNTGWEKVMDVSDRHYTEMRVATKADKATTAAGYGIIDVYTKNQIDALTRHTRKTDFDLNVLKQAVADQNLEKYGLKVGDEKTINGHTYVIAGLNLMKGPHANRVNTNHVGLIVIPHTAQVWNASGNTSTGADGRGAGYLNSDLHYYLKNTVLPMCNTDLGASNLISHNKLLSNAVNTSGYNKLGEASGCASGWDWEDTKICALSEVQVYGAAICSSSLFDTGEACRQLDVFQRYSYTEIFGNEYPWLRDVVSASRAAFAYSSGDASYSTASNTVYVAALVLFH